MKVLVHSHMFPDPAEPSGGIFVLEQIRALRSQGVESVALSPTPWVPPLLKWVPRWQKYVRTPSRDTVQGFQVEYPRVPVLPRGWLFALYGSVYFLFCYRLVKRLVREERIDLMQADTIMPNGFAAILLGRRLHLPVVCTFDGSDVNICPFRSRLNLWATRWALKHVRHE